MKAVPGIAGIFIRWNSTTNEDDAQVSAYNSSSVQSGWTGPDWGSKVASAVALMDYTDSPESLVSIIKEFKSSMHPLKVAGVM